MLFDSIIQFFLNFVLFILDMFPVISVLDGLSFNILPLINVINAVSCIMPVGTMFIVMGLWLILINLNVLASIVHWIIRKIPTVN